MYLNLQLLFSCKIQRAADQLEADKSAFESYRKTIIANSDTLAKPDDSPAVLSLITSAKDRLSKLVYDEDKSFAENLIIIDSIFNQLESDLENTRISVGIENHNNRSGNMQIHTLDGKKIDVLTKSGIYIINGKKRYVVIK